jgi:hypothetical protein
MALLAAGSPLVAGGAVPVMATRYVRVVRSFFHQGVPQPVGAVIEVPRFIAAEAIHCGKAVAAEKPVPVVVPEVVETVEAPAEPIRKRGKRDAG